MYNYHDRNPFHARDDSSKGRNSGRNAGRRNDSSRKGRGTGRPDGPANSGGLRTNARDNRNRPADRQDSSFRREPYRPAGQDEAPKPLLEDRLEGRNPILEALRAGRTINKMWMLKSRDGHTDPTLGRIAGMARSGGAVVLEVDRETLDRMAVSKGHQGVIAQTAAHEYADLDEVIAEAREKGESPFIVLLDDLKDPYNLGSILRIADAAGVHGVVIPNRNSVGLDALTAKASSGAIEHVPVVRVVNIGSTIEALKKDGFWIFGTDAKGTVFYDKADYGGPIAIVMGSEGEGLGRLVRERCDFLLGIPMSGKVNSLNVAVAAGIVVFEAARHRTGSTGEGKQGQSGK